MRTRITSLVTGMVLAGTAGLLATTLHAGPDSWWLDQQLEAVLAGHGFTGAIESTLPSAARPPHRPPARGNWPTALFRHRRRPEQRQQLFRLPFSDPRLR